VDAGPPGGRATCKVNKKQPAEIRAAVRRPTWSPTWSPTWNMPAPLLA